MRWCRKKCKCDKHIEKYNIEKVNRVRLKPGRIGCKMCGITLDIQEDRFCFCCRSLYRQPVGNNITTPKKQKNLNPKEYNKDMEGFKAMAGD